MSGLKKVLTQAESKELGSFCRFAGLSEGDVRALVLSLLKTTQLPFASEIYNSYRA